STNCPGWTTLISTTRWRTDWTRNRPEHGPRRSSWPSKASTCRGSCRRSRGRGRPSLDDEHPAEGTPFGEGPHSAGRRPRRSSGSETRYGRYTGGPDPLAPPVDLAEALASMADDVMAGYGPDQALREYLRRGG